MAMRALRLGTKLGCAHSANARLLVFGSLGFHLPYQQARTSHKLRQSRVSSKVSAENLNVFRYVALHASFRPSQGLLVPVQSLLQICARASAVT